MFCGSENKWLGGQNSDLFLNSAQAMPVSHCLLDFQLTGWFIGIGGNVGRRGTGQGDAFEAKMAGKRPTSSPSQPREAEAC